MANKLKAIATEEQKKGWLTMPIIHLELFVLAAEMSVIPAYYDDYFKKQRPCQVPAGGPWYAESQTHKLSPFDAYDRVKPKYPERNDRVLCGGWIK